MVIYLQKKTGMVAEHFLAGYHYEQVDKIYSPHFIDWLLHHL
jgi:hypothetical protein